MSSLSALIPTMLIWAATHTGLPMPAHPPTITFDEQCSIERRFFSDPAHVCGKGAFRVIALYSSGEIVLPNNWQADDPIDQSILVHELVHYLQDGAGIVMGKANPCEGQLIERPAYEAQMAWLAAMGIEPMAALRFDRESLASLTSCRGPWGGRR